MLNIRPVADLETDLDDISETVHQTAEPVFLTRNGYGDMVLMSMDAWEVMNFENEIYLKLMEAQAEATNTNKRLSHNEVFGPLRRKIAEFHG